MALTYYDDNGGAGDKEFATTSSWSTGSVPTGANPAVLTDDRTPNNLNGGTQTAALPDDFWILNFSGSVGGSGDHLIFDTVGGGDSMNLKIEGATGTEYWIDINDTDTIADARIDVPRNGRTEVNLGGTGDYTKIYLVRGRTNLIGSGADYADVWISRVAGLNDVFLEVQNVTQLAQIRQDSGRVESACNWGTGMTLWEMTAGTALMTGQQDITELNLKGGTFRWDGATTGTPTITNAYIRSGKLDLRQSANERTIDNIYIWPQGLVDARGVKDLMTMPNIVMVGSGGRILGMEPTDTIG